jgi:hypothetical protein
MREVNSRLKAWMDRLSMSVRVDAVGNPEGSMILHGSWKPIPFLPLLPSQPASRPAS